MDWIERTLYRVATAANERLSAYWRGQPQQLQYLLELQARRSTPEQLPAFDEVGFRLYSQFDEDGLLLYVLALIGTGARRCVDIGSGQRYCAAIGQTFPSKLARRRQIGDNGEPARENLATSTRPGRPSADRPAAGPGPGAQAARPGLREVPGVPRLPGRPGPPGPPGQNRFPPTPS